MKSIVKKVETVIQTKHYPYLGKWSDADTEFIVLFHTSNTGIVVFDKNSDRRLGVYSTDWAESEFTFFVGTIELSN